MIQINHVFETNILTDGKVKYPDFDQDVDINCYIDGDKYIVKATNLSNEKLEELKSKYTFLRTEEEDLQPLNMGDANG